MSKTDEKFLDPEKHLADIGCPTPVTNIGKSPVVEAGDIVMIELLGGFSFGHVALTKDQVKALERWDPVENEPDNKLQAAMESRNLSRIVQVHGVRLMAFLAGRGLLERNRDPVLSLAEMLEEHIGEAVIDLSEEEGGQ